MQLDQTTWQRLEALFQAALERPVNERQAFATRECCDDAELQALLLGMLRHAAGCEREIESIIHDGAARLMLQGAVSRGRFGAYSVVREIGRGGMGVVFEAVRDDDQYHKRVALKVAPGWHDSPTGHQRFLQERQILANLEHPNIARLLDGGTDAGVPYIALELVDGVPITTFCRERQLSVRERLALLLPVCHAVDAAHSQLVVHRDLKPNNVLVTPDGTPKLLDFGISKLLDHEHDPSATLGPSGFTPNFVSPEQVRNRPVTTRTDVYGLGLILYELLADVPAQVVDHSSPAAFEQSVCDVIPALPSARATHVERRVLRGDLDTIVMTAIAKDPSRRYASVAALAADLERFLVGMPIQARPATWLYRATCFTRRHAVGVAAGAAVVASLVIGLVSTVYQSRRAERRFNQVRALANMFVFDVDSIVAQLPDSSRARAAIVQTAVTYLDSLSPDIGDDRELSQNLATLYLRIADIQGDLAAANLGAPSTALRNLDRAEALLAGSATAAESSRLLRDIAERRARMRRAGTGGVSIAPDRAPSVTPPSRPAGASLGPGETALAMYTAAGEGRYAEAESYLARDALAAFHSELVRNSGGTAVVWDLETRSRTLMAIEIVSERVEGDHAQVMLRMRYRDGTVRDNPEALVKERGVWKVTVS